MTPTSLFLGNLLLQTLVEEWFHYENRSIWYRLRMFEKVNNIYDAPIFAIYHCMDFFDRVNVDLEFVHACVCDCLERVFG